VVVTSTTDRIFDRVDELRASGGEAEGVVADLREQSGVDTVVARAETAYGGVDVLVNNAGMTSISDRDPAAAVARWHASLERNLTTTFLMIRAVVGGMPSARSSPRCPRCERHDPRAPGEGGRTQRCELALHHLALAARRRQADRGRRRFTS
jgi:NAD(P)-dependent dehydrogenase (short-subunit alcohol dehydrogenase family)